jgi:hypothetical protein
MTRIALFGAGARTGRTLAAALKNILARRNILKQVLSTIFVMLFCGTARAAMYRVPGDYGSISEAVQAAQRGDTVQIMAGTYLEALILDLPIHLMGEGPKQCILKTPEGRDSGSIIVVNSHVRISGMTIRDGEAGIEMKTGTSMKMENCHIIGNGDGIVFEDDFNTFLSMRDCLVMENDGDGVDLEGTQGIFLHSQFVKNRDDGLDLDDDSGVLIYNCIFSDNRDDGIEIRIRRRTHAIILDSVFERNGEDGLEIINSPVEDGDYNVLCMQNCAFNLNQRFGVGFVAQKEEEHTGEMSKTAVYAVGNSFSGNVEGHVSPNYAPVFDAPEAYRETVKATLERDGKQVSQEIPVRIPLLVGIYNLQPTTDGTMLRDAEGVTISQDRVYVADDDSHRIYVLDKRTGSVVNAISTQPFPESKYSAPGPEGLDMVDRDTLLLADDDGRSLYSLSLNPEAFGQVIRRQDTTSVGAVEGVERLDRRLLLASGTNKLYSVSTDLQALGEPVKVGFEDFGSHIAGIGIDRTRQTSTKAHYRRVFATLSAYVKDQNWRNHRSAFFAMDPDLSEVRGFWHLGPFSNDPRGIAVLNGLIYVADGRSSFVDRDTGEMNRGGQKVFVFMLEDDGRLLEEVLPELPVRKMK